MLHLNVNTEGESLLNGYEPYDVWVLVKRFNRGGHVVKEYPTEKAAQDAFEDLIERFAEDPAPSGFRAEVYRLEILPVWLDGVTMRGTREREVAA